MSLSMSREPIEEQSLEAHAQAHAQGRARLRFRDAWFCGEDAERIWRL